MKLRDATNDKKLTQELEKVGCELEPNKEESLLKLMGPRAKKNLAKCRSRALLGPGRFPQAVRHLGCWLEVGGGAGNDQTKNHCDAHQLRQIRYKRVFAVLVSVTRPSHHTIYFSTLFGSLEWENVADFELNGSLSHRALPALRQLADDLTRLLPSWPSFVWDWVPLLFWSKISLES